MGLTRAMHKPHKQSGAVSLFLVVFATLLITVVTISFMRQMIQDQFQATNLDLSQSAYDSAQAGVQDAQRALLRYMATCTSDATACEALNAEIKSGDWAQCNGALDAVVDTTGPEIKVQQSSSGPDLEQAYTCVTIDLDTDDVVGQVAANEVKVIPLTGSEGFDTIRIDWYTLEDLGSGTTVAVTAPLATPPLMRNTVSTTLWRANRPSLLEAQLIQYGQNGFTLNDFNANASSESNSNTLFLYPSCAPSGNPSPNNCVSEPNTGPFALDARTDKDGQPVNVNCVSQLTSGGYACSQKLTLPNPIGGGSRVAYLRIKPLYNATHFRVMLENASTGPVTFSGVQPAVDSTGRANDIFRRVESRIDLEGGAFAFPAGAVDVTGSFCKNFAVTNNTADFTELGTDCTP